MKPAFDPNLPFEAAGKPAFDPTKPFEEVSAEAQAAPEVIQEMHPDFTAPDRFIVKNVTTGDEAAIGYLKQRHPNLDIDTDPSSGQIRAKAKGVNEPYKVLDPDKGFLGNLNPLSGEFYRDLGDVTYDAASMLGTGAATAAGGLAGTAAGPAGTLGGAALAGGASSAAFEGLRQKLGNALGVEQEFDPMQVGIAGAAGAASPLLFGTGGQVGGKLGKAILGDLGEEAAKVAQSAQRGAIGYGVDNIVKPGLTKLGSLLSGASEDSLRGLAQNYDAFKVIEKSPTGARTFAKETAQTLGDTLRGAKTAYGDAYRAGVDEAGDAVVNITAAREALEKAVGDAEETALASGTKGAKALASRLREALEDTFYRTEPMLDEAGEAMLDDAGKALTQLVPNDELPVKAALELEKDLAEMAGLHKMGASNVKGGVGNRFAASATREDKLLGSVAIDSKKALEASLKDVLSPETLAAKQKLGGVINLEKEVGGVLGKKPATIMKTLRNISKPTNQENLELLHQLDTDFGTDMVKRAQMANVLGVFRKPGALPLSSGGVSGLARAGIASGAGAVVGQYLERASGEGSGLQGALIGGTLGGFMGSPAMMRRAIALGLKGGQFNQGMGPLRPAVGQAVLEETMSPWMGVQ